MAMHKPLPDPSYIWDSFDYKPLTGELVWRRSQGTCAAGDIAGGFVLGYIRIAIHRKKYQAHRLIWLWLYGEDPGTNQIDHINMIRQDNRPSNLRLATQSQNQCNARVRKNNKIGVKGVTCRLGLNGKQRYTSEIYYCTKKFSLGTFDSLEEASAAYAAAAERLHGEFARTN